MFPITNTLHFYLLLQLQLNIFLVAHRWFITELTLGTVHIQYSQYLGDNNRGDSLILRTACARAQFGGCSSTTNSHNETGRMVVSS